MENKCIYGKEIAERLDQRTIEFVEECRNKGRRIPKLVCIAIGDHPASVAYMKGLRKKCEKVKVELETVVLDASISDFELIRTIHGYNKMISIDGILLQMPLPSHMNREKIVLEIDPLKDVDGLHPLNTGLFYQGQEAFVPCTALSAMEFIHESGMNLDGKEVVVVGRSNVIGRPVAQLCLNEHASVTVVHSKSLNIEKICSHADVVIAAAGVPKMIKKNWLKKGAVVIDVGINYDENGKMCGDVDFDDVIDQVSKISPVPKGVGVVTNSMLMQNLIFAYQRKG
ncbi:bifunctional 5,10-methylenetetrahydrofolate dehydrogenase/5,10-methenyltetrahydrofolate cyclohydrolase [Traorella massiliensis]|uniref:bifunctional 5,10-methylenetetrahydrofolate dehydrogenase/5,10-methenyltetrahydrofolate cyclohydrolase n=1 Tax=Traorella massiliensis TaxID=1903263 RepID=UPI00248DA677|nr:bifunctional 5,10-methylenetetrahydrofolate dehydrogenase/5,10-methenyltetrahydrofolate cyclohydrolase [Traorella massiliensis]